MDPTGSVLKFFQRICEELDLVHRGVNTKYAFDQLASQSRNTKQLLYRITICRIELMSERAKVLYKYNLFQAEFVRFDWSKQCIMLRDDNGEWCRFSGILPSYERVNMELGLAHAKASSLRDYEATFEIFKERCANANLLELGIIQSEEDLKTCFGVLCKISCDDDQLRALIHVCILEIESPPVQILCKYNLFRLTMESFHVHFSFWEQKVLIRDNKNKYHEFTNHLEGITTSNPTDESILTHVNNELKELH